MLSTFLLYNCKHPKRNDMCMNVLHLYYPFYNFSHVKTDAQVHLHDISQGSVRPTEADFDGSKAGFPELHIVA